MSKYILIFIIICSYLVFADTEIIKELKEKSHANQNDRFVIFYFEMVSCVKCYVEPIEIMKHLESNNKLKRYKIIAVVVCDRDIELNIFKKEQNWKHTLYRNDGTFKSKLKAGTDILTTLINSKNKIKHLKSGNPKQNYDKIIEFLSNEDWNLDEGRIKRKNLNIIMI